MSNRIVPQIYRQIIDDVIANVQVDFEEYGMEEEVLNNLQAKWESKLLQTHVADFARAPSAANTSPGPPDSSAPSLSGAPSTSNPSPAISAYGPTGTGLVLPGQGGGMGYGQGGYDAGSGMNGVASGSNGGGGGLYGDVRVKHEPGDDILRIRGGAGPDIKPVIPSEDRKPEPNAQGLLPGDEVIDSDLDDSDDELKDEGEEDGEGEGDIVFCVYDKVQRVKNKWKTVFKDGMIHINGRDYLFGKCTGEFEW